MRRALAIGLILVAAACGSGNPPARTIPAELLFIPGDSVRVIETRDGSTVATLPAGAFDARLSGGGDVAEAYVAGMGGVQRVRPGRPFRVDRVADATGTAPYQAALVPAPGLTNFVGDRTVLVTLSADGQVAGYQAGTRIWSHAVRAGILRRVDDFAALRQGQDWFLVAPETGALSSLATGCADGPVGEVTGRLIVACKSATGNALAAAGLPSGVPFELHPVRQDVSVLAWPDGSWRRYDDHGVGSALAHGSGGGRPALAPDGSRLVWPHGYPDSTALAFSRDGTFLYALGGGHLRVYAAGGHNALRDTSLDGSDIALVAGG